MRERVPEALCDPVLSLVGIRHGFGQRSSPVPGSTVFPRQVHGIDVFEVGRSDDSAGAGEAARSSESADAIVAASPGRVVGIVTADCVPILAASADGRAVAAIHAGWRGLSAGVIEAGIEVLRTRSHSESIVAAVGPAARGCCYEVDAPVERALSARYAGQLEGVLRPGRAGHFQLDLPRLASRILAGLGLASSQIGLAHRVCTICDAHRFESYRRDGPSAGRLRHFVGCRVGRSGQG